MNYGAIRVALTYRVLQHWRVPVFRRLADTSGIQFCAFYGEDFRGTKVVSGKDLSGFSHKKLLTIPIRLPSRQDSAFMPVCPTLAWHLWKYRPDVILAEGGSNLANNIFVFAYARLTRTPVVWWTLGELPGSAPSSLLRRLWHSAVRFLEKRASVWLGYSSIALRYFDRMGYDKTRQFRAVNCVDTDAALARIPAFANRAQQLRTELKLEGCHVVLFVGAIYPSKRLDVLIEALASIQSAHPTVRLLVVGGGPYRKAVEEHARRCDVPAIFTGEILDDIAAYYLLGDIFVLPGLGGLSISEAMAYGLPVVATQADGCEVDLVENGFNGYLIDTGNVAQLAQTLDTVLSNGDMLAQMGANSTWIIRHRHNINTYMDNVLAAIRCAADLSRDAHDGPPTR